MTATIDDTDLGWVEFTEEDPVEPCCLHSENAPRAVGALYIPQCGRHPLCRPCVGKYRQAFGGLIGNLTFSQKDVLTIYCEIHSTQRSYDHNPVVIVGSA